MNKENCALKLVDEIILYYDARSKKKHQIKYITLNGKFNGTLLWLLHHFKAHSLQFNVKFQRALQHSVHTFLQSQRHIKYFI